MYILIFFYLFKQQIFYKVYIMFGVVLLIFFGIIAYIIYTKHSKSLKSPSNIVEHDHCIIIGGSIGGMVTAGYLSKYFKQITIIESDDVLNDTLMKSTSDQILDYRCQLESPTSIGRSGVPQMYQLHVIEGEGYKILQELFPELENKLLNEYNIRTYSLKSDTTLNIDGALLNHDLTEDIRWLGIDRFTLETFFRKEFSSKFENKIQWKCNSRVKELIVDRSLNIVKGVKYRSKENTDSSVIDLHGDFIIDCSGRNSSSIKWLEQSFNLIIPREEIHFGSGYVTLIGERFQTGDPTLDTKSIICTSVNAPNRNVGCYITPIRKIKPTDKNSLGTLSTVTVHCVNNQYPPNDSLDNLLDWLKENIDPIFYSILKSTKVSSPLVPHRRAFDHRKYVELLKNKWPENYILLGDATCTFNPQFGQGMTHACRQARLLNQIFKQKYDQIKNISRIFNSQASKITEECWLVSTSSDWKTPSLKIVRTDINGKIETYQRDENFVSTSKCQIRPSLIIQFFQWYSYWFLQCASKSGKLTTDFLLVMNQHKGPFILIKPTTFLTVSYAILTNYFNLSKK